MSRQASKSFNGVQEHPDIDFRIARGRSQCESIDLGMKCKNNYAAVRMFHFHVAAFSRDLGELKPLQRPNNLPPGR